jgi:hypothetical protein
MNGKAADDNDMIAPEDEDSFGDDASAEDDQALQIAAGRKQPQEPDDGFDPNADLSQMTM